LLLWWLCCRPLPCCCCCCCCWSGGDDLEGCTGGCAPHSSLLWPYAPHSTHALQSFAICLKHLQRQHCELGQ
jgi:hypothetical protein